MNPITPYEQLLAQEMEQLPLPDSMESIWAEIETQLDVELPAGDGKNPPPRKPAPARRTTRIVRHWRLFVIAGVVVVTLFLLVQKNKRQRNPDRGRIIVPEQQTVNPDSVAPLEPPAVPTPVNPSINDKKIQPSSGKPAVKDTVSVIPPDTPFLIPPPVFIDTAANRPVSSPLIIPDKTPAPKPPVKEPENQGRKRRGVPNVDDSDYKLVPVRKDTPKRGP